MNDSRGAFSEIDYRRHFSWVRLFQGGRIARDLRKLLLASLALLLLAGGNWLFVRLPFAPAGATSPMWPWQSLGQADRGPAVQSDLGQTFGLSESAPAAILPQSAAPWVHLLLGPFQSLTQPASELVRIGNSWSQVAYAWTRLLWALAVWSVFGGAISRMAAVEFSRDKRISLRQAVVYSSRRFLSYFASPLLPLIAIGIGWGLCALGGVIGRIPQAGPIVVGALYGIALVIGFVMTLVLIGVGVGWPLMFATISVEGSDAFDGFSRSYSYVYSRPWHYLWNAIVALIYGVAVLVVATVFVGLVLLLSAWGIQSGMGEANAREFFSVRAGWAITDAPPGALLSDGSGIGAALVAGWQAFLVTLLAGLVASYFWTSTTIIYFLLRRSDDATDFDEIFLAEDDSHDDLLPQVGVAASEQPVVERPPREVGDPPVPTTRPESSEAPETSETTEAEETAEPPEKTGETDEPG